MADGVTGVLLFVALVPGDDVAQGTHERVHDLQQLLGIDLLCECVKPEMSANSAVLRRRASLSWSVERKRSRDG